MSATSLFICHQTANCDIFDDISLTETEIFFKLDEVVGDKAAIYISYRLSSCRFCDNIAVFDQG